MDQPRIQIESPKPSIHAKLELIYALLDDLTADLVANYQEVDVEFRCKAK